MAYYSSYVPILMEFPTLMGSDTCPMGFRAGFYFWVEAYEIPLVWASSYASGVFSGRRNGGCGGKTRSSA